MISFEERIFHLIYVPRRSLKQSASLLTSSLSDNEATKDDIELTATERVNRLYPEPPQDDIEED